MEDNNQNNVQTQDNNQVQQDFRMVHPEIIGELRKNKIGKPVIVIELFLLFGILFAGLPFINSQLEDENSRLNQLLHGKPVSIQQTTTVAAGEEYTDGSKSTIISSSLKMKYKNIIIKNISLFKQDTYSGIKCSISSYNGEINLDESDYFFEVSNSSGTKIAAFKLTGVIDNASKDVEFISSSFQYNDAYSYQGRLVEMTDDDYPDVSFDDYVADSNGIAMFTCKKKNRTLTYTFKNNYLIGIKDDVTVNQNDENYLNLKKEYEEKVEQLGTSYASVSEEENGLVYQANLDLSGDYKIKVKDYDYYPSNTLAKKIAYTEISKGYDCK